jgi:hypothetical protein
MPIVIQGSPSRYPKSFLRDLRNDETENLSSIASETDGSDSISTYLSSNFATWREFISESKKNRQWIIQEWISATKFWRNRILKRYLIVWNRISSCKLKAQAYYTHGMLRRSLLYLCIIGKTMRRTKDRMKLSSIFLDWTLNMQRQKYKESKIVEMIGLTKIFTKWKNLYCGHMLAPLLNEFQNQKLRKTFVKWKTITINRSDLILKIIAYQKSSIIFRKRFQLHKLFKIALFRLNNLCS